MAENRPGLSVPGVAADPATRKAAAILVVLLVMFVLLQSLIPLRTAIKIGADEDFELSKAVLCLRGFHLYSEIWNDQPPLNTFLITQILKRVSPSILGPRLLTVGFALGLLASIFLLALRVNGLLAAALATGVLIASPGFMELSSSCMQEVPAVAPMVAALAALLLGRQSKSRITELVAGVIFTAALQIKLIGVIYLPLVLLVLWLRRRESDSPLLAPAPSHGKRVVRQSQDRVRTKIRLCPGSLFWSLFVFGVSVAIGFLVLNAVTGNPLLLQLKQSWGAHFASAKSFEYGSPRQHPFDWSVLPKNWDTTLPALVGVIVLLRQAGRIATISVPVAWLALTFVVFPTHKPWWSYYYIHNSIPLCWCAAVGMAAVWQWAKARRRKGAIVLATTYAICAFSWMAGRVYLQIDSIRDAPRISSALVLQELERFKPLTTFLFADEPIYSFHSGIPMPPRLAMISLKRMWSGDMNNARLMAEMEAVKPGLIMLANDTRAVPFHVLLETEYRMVYQDDKHRLYAHRSIANKAEY